MATTKGSQNKGKSTQATSAAKSTKKGLAKSRKKSVPATAALPATTNTKGKHNFTVNANDLDQRPHVLFDPNASENEAHHKVRSMLEMKGWKSQDTSADHNCLFRVISFHIFGSEDYHLKVRQIICDEMKEHGNRYVGFFEIEKPQITTRRRKSETCFESESEARCMAFLRVHIQEMRKVNTWGTHMEILAAANVFCIRFEVFENGNAHTMFREDELTLPCFPISCYSDLHYEILTKKNSA